jgi:hypothetical protein
VPHKEAVNDRSAADADSAKIRGWVYVITNQAMPHLVKVGFSTKDPHLRAKKLAGTGVPHPFVVAYDALVYGPRDLERRVHKKLAHMREGKEWFKCSVAQAIEAIHELERDGVLLEQVNQQHASFPSRSNTSPSPQDQMPGVEATTIRSTRAPLLTVPAAAASSPRAAGTYRGLCGHCGESFSATLARGATVTRCPACLRMQDVSGFLRAELIL